MLVLIERCEAFGAAPSSTVGGASRVEHLAEGVVSVEWTLPGVGEEAPRVHLHVGDGTKPPVDFAFVERDGRLVGVQVVLQDEAVGEQHVFGGGLICERGVPVADLTPWRGEERILDHLFTPTVAWEPVGTLAVRVARTAGLPTKECAVDGLRLVLDERGLLLGLRFPGFSESDVAAVARAAAGLSNDA
jgi:hypothetical protein